MAHEIGHSLGLRHDPDGCCMEADAEQGGCVMEAATGYAQNVVPPDLDASPAFLWLPLSSLFCKVRVITACLWGLSGRNAKKSQHDIRTRIRVLHS